MKKPLVGVTPLIDHQLNSYWMIPGYMDATVEAGGIPVMLPFKVSREDVAQLVASLDGIILTGGPDIDPAYFGEEKKETCNPPLVERDELEHMYIEEALAQNKAIFAICRGHQYLNVLLGGTLYQDIPTEVASDVEHSMVPPYDIARHRVKLVEGAPLREIFHKELLYVNSYHHQSIKELAPGLKAMAYSPDGLIEAYYKPDHPFIWGVQWHPEFMFRAYEEQTEIFKAFVRSMSHGN